MEGSPEGLELSYLYHSLTDRLPKDAQEVMPLDYLLNPLDENDAYEPDLSDTVLNVVIVIIGMTKIYLGHHQTHHLVIWLLKACRMCFYGLRTKRYY
jgi:hypothetical protein